MANKVEKRVTFNRRRLKSWSGTYSYPGSTVSDSVVVGDISSGTISVGNVGNMAGVEGDGKSANAIGVNQQVGK